MAKVYSAPAGYEAPPFNMDDYRDNTWQAKEQAYIDRLADRAKMNGTNPLHGEVIQWQVADGYAQYLVWNTKPLELIHLQLGDAYSANSILLRGLKLADVRDMVEHAQRLRAFFAKDTTTEGH